METAIDILLIQQLVAWERHWRDGGQWDRMAETYHPESLVRVAWFTGSGPEFVEASRSIHQSGQSKHRLSIPRVRVNGAHGIVETDTIIETRTKFEEVEVDTAASCRLLSRVRKGDNQWRLASLDCIYEKDTLHRMGPWQRVPIDRKLLASFRP
jgi:SnoaL-like domain